MTPWIFVAAVLALPILVVAIVFLVVPIFKGLVWLIAHIFQFILAMIADTLRLIGSLLASVILGFLIMGNIVIGRWSATAHYGRAVQAEVGTVARCFYRICLGNLIRLLCLTPLTEGLERRIPEVVAAAPGADKPSKRQGQFDGYTIVGSLPGGGSGGRLYVADPSPEKMAGFTRNGLHGVDQVVIKSFSLEDGSSLPQIVRENRALTAAKRLGLILEHDLTNERFYYIMRYVPGEPLGVVTTQLHAVASNEGLEQKELHSALAYASDLLQTLRNYHAGGLWHKDVKPDNIIIHDHRAHLVDFGLITPLRSSMTLTTHGTEYFRDPEMVRMALKGMKVHEVDGAKFDIYAAGAVLYSMIENSFPAHGGLSQITKRCPEAIRWIVRRAMTDYDKRYESSTTMLADLEAVCNAADPFTVRPVDLPSMNDGDGAKMAAAIDEGTRFEEPYGDPSQATPPPIPDPVQAKVEEAAHHAAAAVAAAGAAAAAKAAGPIPANTRIRSRPKLRVTDWLTGRYEVVEEEALSPGYSRGAPIPPEHDPVLRPAAEEHMNRPQRPRRRSDLSAKEQVLHARGRAKAARQRAHDRMRSASTRRKKARKHASGLNAGVLVALLLGIMVLVALVLGLFTVRQGLEGGFEQAYSNAERARPTRPQARVDTRRAPSVPFANAAAPAESTTHPDAKDQTILVMRSNFTLTPGISSKADTQVLRLAQRGFEVIDGAQDGVHEQIEANAGLEADLRNELALTPFHTVQAENRIQRWLDAQDTIEFVLWIDRHPSIHDEHYAWLISDPDTPREVEDLAEVVVNPES